MNVSPEMECHLPRMISEDLIQLGDLNPLLMDKVYIGWDVSLMEAKRTVTQKLASRLNAARSQWAGALARSEYTRRSAYLLAACASSKEEEADYRSGVALAEQMLLKSKVNVNFVSKLVLNNVYHLGGAVKRERVGIKHENEMPTFKCLGVICFVLETWETLACESRCKPDYEQINLDEIVEEVE